MNKKIKINNEMYYLLQRYYDKFGEPAFSSSAVSTGHTKFPEEATTEEVIDALKQCMNEDIKLSVLYPSLIEDANKVE